MNQKPSIFVFLGPPGAGKGTLSQYCVRNLGWVQLSTGNLCRTAAMTQGSHFSTEIATALNAGRLIPDSIINAMVREWLESQLFENKTIILDGYPRVREQAALLHHFLQQYTDIATYVVRFVISEGTIFDRLTTRLICSDNTCQKVYTIAGNDTSLIETMVCDTCCSTLTKRADDDINVVRERLVTYHKHEKELLDFYHAMGQSVVDLVCNDPSESVFKRFCAIVGGIA